MTKKYSRRKWMKSSAMATSGLFGHKAFSGTVLGRNRNQNTPRLLQQDDLIGTEAEREWGSSFSAQDSYTNSTFQTIEQDAGLSATLSWYGGFATPNLGWQHDFGLASTMQVDLDGPEDWSEDRGDNLFDDVVVKASENTGQRSDEISIELLNSDQYTGVWPVTRSDGRALPEWVEVIMESTLSAAALPVAVAITTGNVVDSMAPPRGVDEYGYGFTHRHKYGLDGVSWFEEPGNLVKDGCTHHRFLYIDDYQDGGGSRAFCNGFEASVSYKAQQRTDAAVADPCPVWDNDEAKLSYEIDVFEEQEPSRTECWDAAALDSFLKDDSTDPREMSEAERDRYGITKVKPDPSVLTSQSNNSDGPTLLDKVDYDILNEAEEMYIADDIPFNVHTVGDEAY